MRMIVCLLALAVCHGATAATAVIDKNLIFKSCKEHVEIVKVRSEALNADNMSIEEIGSVNTISSVRLRELRDKVNAIVDAYVSLKGYDRVIDVSDPSVSPEYRRLSVDGALFIEIVDEVDAKTAVGKRGE